MLKISRSSKASVFKNFGCLAQDLATSLWAEGNAAQSGKVKIRLHHKAVKSMVLSGMRRTEPKLQQFSRTTKVLKDGTFAMRGANPLFCPISLANLEAVDSA